MSEKKTRRISGKALAALIIILTAALALAASAVLARIFRPESESYLKSERGITNEDLRSRTGGDVKLDFVYSERDTWGRGTADYLAGKMTGYDYIKTSVIRDEDYSGGDGSGFAVFIGHTSQNSESYLDAYRRLGSDGLEISRTADANGETVSVTILAFTEKQAKRGADRFADYFLSANYIRKAFTRLYVSDVSGDRLGFVSVETRSAGDVYDVLVVSQPDSDSHTAALLRAMKNYSDPGLVVVSGGISRAGNRDAIASVSTMIEEALGETLWTWSPCASDPTGAGADLAFEITGAARNGVRAAGRDETAYTLFTDADGSPLGVFVNAGLDSLTSSDKVCERLSLLLAAVNRAADGVPSAILLPALPASCVADAGFAVTAFDPDAELNLLGNWERFSDSRADAVYAAAKDGGVPVISFFAGYNNSGVIRIPDSGTTIALCGSLGFESPGVGGQFRLNNALRGGTLILFVLGREVTAETLNASRFSEVFD